ncbi:MAG: hypothetical protein ACYDDF_05990 [Thermoplasmatota archaeon]
MSSPAEMPMVILSYWTGCMALSALCALALTALLLIYGRNLRRAPSRFGTGLFIFAGALWIESLGSIFVWWSLSAEYDADVAIPMMALRAIELVGVAILAFVSME